METLYILFQSLLDQTDKQFVRYLHDKINWEVRMIAIVGPRGVGKTTLLLQHIKQYHRVADTLYVQADDLYFSNHRLFDLANDFVKYGGRHLFIDEIHKYPNWSQELKMMYDYLPKLQVVFTGSSILDIYKGYADLSRRVLSYHLHGLSFREYLALKENINLPVYSLRDILKNKVTMDAHQPLPLFKNYLQEGYYPFFKEGGYYERLQVIINLILETDIPAFTGMSVATVRKLKQLLYIVSQSVPFKPNYTKLSSLIETHRNNLGEYLHYIEKSGLIFQLRTAASGMRMLGKVEKLYLNNPNLIYALAGDKVNVGNVRETFFVNQMQINHNVLAAEKGDFKVKQYTFEVGGEGKTMKQVVDVPDAYVVKDNIEYGFANVVPLWAFGFNY
jgi:predicted AAA+ superfamily ATPase